MFLIPLLIAAEILTGIIIVKFFDPERRFSLAEKLFSGILLGAIFGSFLILLLSLIFGTIGLSIVIYLAIAISLFFWQKRYLLNELKKFNPKYFSLKLSLFLYFIIFLAILLFYVTYLFSILSYDKTGNLKAGLPGWGDNAFHLSLIEKFSVSSPFTLEHPLFSGTNLTYPFIIDFISGVFRHLGANQLLAFRLPLLFFGIIAICLLFLFICRVVKSPAFALLAIFLIFWGSGLGFAVLTQDIISQGLSFDFFTNPPHQYTNFDQRTGTANLNSPSWTNGIVWIVPIVSFLGHQRSFLLGLALISFLLLGIYHYAKSKEFWRFGLVAGLLPLTHGHSLIFLFLLMATLFWFCLKYWRTWILFAAATFLIALSQLIYLFSNSAKAGAFFKPWFGWMACSHQASWLCGSPANSLFTLFSFSVKNFGAIFLFWILAIIFLLAEHFFPRLKLHFNDGLRLPFLAGSFIIFLAANLFLFQPWEFDNNKILFYWWIFVIIFAVIPTLMALWKKNIITKTLAIFLIILTLSAGATDFVAKIYSKNRFGYDSSFLRIAASDWIRKNTSPNAIFLTSPNAGNFVSMMTGRPVYLGYDGWLWSQGIDYLPKTEKARKILLGDASLACKEKIRYIVLEPIIRQTFLISENILKQNSEIVFSESNYQDQITILKINCSK